MHDDEMLANSGNMNNISINEGGNQNYQFLTSTQRNEMFSTTAGPDIRQKVLTARTNTKHNVNNVGQPSQTATQYPTARSGISPKENSFNENLNQNTSLFTTNDKYAA